MHQVLAIVGVGVIVLTGAVSAALAERRQAQLVPVRVKRNRR